MSLPDGFDLAALLAPIPGDRPQGANLREDYTAQSPYNRLRDARSGARDAEKQREEADPGASAPPPDPAPLWRALRNLGLRLLAEQSKDLEIAAWLTEALLRGHGLCGLAAGSRLIAGLIERYWDDVYPLPDEYGIETRVAPIMGLNGRSGNGSLMAPLFRIELFNLADGSPLVLHQYQASARLATMGTAARQQRMQAGTHAFEDIEKDARSAAGRLSLTKIRDDAVEAVAAWETMSTILDEKAGSESPSTSTVCDLLKEIAQIAARYVPDTAIASTTVDPVVEFKPESDQMPDSHLAMTRESALHTLVTIAAFFRRTEPHSPLSYTLDEAVRRARLPWLDLLDEVMADRSSREAFLITLGIRPPVPPE